MSSQREYDANNIGEQQLLNFISSQEGQPSSSARLSRFSVLAANRSPQDNTPLLMNQPQRLPINPPYPSASDTSKKVGMNPQPPIASHPSIQEAGRKDSIIDRLPQDDDAAKSYTASFLKQSGPEGRPPLKIVREIMESEQSVGKVGLAQALKTMTDRVLQL